jgi:hypothetical protein
MRATDWKVGGNQSSSKRGNNTKSAHKSESIAFDNIEENVCKLLSDNLLYLMSKLIQNDWWRDNGSNSSKNLNSDSRSFLRHSRNFHGKIKSFEQQEHSVRVLTALVKLLLQPVATSSNGSRHPGEKLFAIYYI